MSAAMNICRSSRRFRKVSIRYSLKRLFVGLTIICGLIGYWVHTAHVQRDAVAAIRAAGGIVTYCFETEIVDLRCTNPACLSALLCDTVPVDMFCHVIGVEYTGSSASVFKSIAKLRGLRDLTLGGISREGDLIAQISRLRNLKYLRIVFASNSGSDLCPDLGILAEFKQLQELDIQNAARATGRFEFVRSLDALRSLEISNAELGDKDLKAIGSRTQLLVLTLHNCSIDPAYLDSLGSLVSTQRLFLDNPLLAGKDIRFLERMKNLRHLYFNCNRIDRTMKSILTNHKTLISVTINGVGISPPSVMNSSGFDERWESKRTDL